MKRLLCIASVFAVLITGCASKSVGDNSWDDVNKADNGTHVYFASGQYSCYSDGSFWSNVQFDKWVEDHNDDTVYQHDWTKGE